MKYERQKEIEKYLVLHGSASLEKLCSLFKISINTARRDIAALIDSGIAIKVHGGVKYAAPESGAKTELHAKKQLIGYLARTLIKNGETVFIDSGTTMLALIAQLGDAENCTVVSHSLLALHAAAAHKNLTVVSLGGVLNAENSAFNGLETIRALADYPLDKAFLSAGCVSLSHGLSIKTFLEAELKKAVVEHCQTRILLADDTKFDQRAIQPFCPLSKLTAIVTNQRPPESYMQFCTQNNIAALF